MQQEEQFGCGKFSVVGPVERQIDKLGYKRLLCDTYRCLRCRPRKLPRVRARIAEIAGERKLQRLATLTLDPARIPSSVRSDRYIRECWRKMRVLLARRFGASVQFIAVLEFQKSGVAHLHVLLGVYIPQDWLSEAWQSIGGGRIVDIRFVDVHRVAGYLACYLTGDKVQHTLSLLPLRARIFSCSRSIILWGRKDKTGWWLCKNSLDYLRERAVSVENERWEALEDLKPFGLEVLMYFEAWLIPEAPQGLDPFRVMRALIQNKAAGASQHALP